jgi:hypothetical protein
MNDLTQSSIRAFPLRFLQAAWFSGKQFGKEEIKKRKETTKMKGKP